MNNLRSKNQANATEPIVYAFDINSDCKQYTFGISQFNATKNIEQNLYVLRKTPFWKSFLSQEVSCYQDSKNTYISNFGDTFLGKQILIFYNKNQTNEYSFAQSYDKKNKTTNYTISNSSGKEINLDNVTIDYDVYIESSDNDEVVMYNEGVKFSNKKINLSPHVLQTMTFISGVQFSDTDEIYLTLEDESGDLVLLASDYECAIPKNDKLNVTTIIPFVNDNIENVYYTDKSDYDKVRFVMSDYGRYISHSTSKDNKPFENNLGFLLSVKTKDDSNKNVSVRFSIDNKDYATNLTSNF